MLPYYLFMIPISFLFLGLGMIAYFERVDIRGYGLEDFLHNVEEEKRNKQRPANKTVGLICIVIAMVLLVAPLFYHILWK